MGKAGSFTLKTDKAMADAIKTIMEKKGIAKKKEAIKYALTITRTMLVFEEITGTSIGDLSAERITELKKKLNAVERELKRIRS